MSGDALDYLGCSRLAERLMSVRLFLTRADYQQLTDKQLVVASVGGDNRAYEALVRKYQKLVYNVVYQLAHNHEFASDVTQDTFVKAYRSLPSFRQDAQLKPWLLRIASNTALNKLRDEKLRQHLSLGPMDDDDEQAIDPPDDCDVEKEVEWRLSQAMVVDALKELSPRRRHVFLLCYQHGLAYAEIASITGETESSIKALLFRTREQMRQLLKDKMKD